MTRPADRPVDFFISYSQADVRWATWIAWELETAGHTTVLQAWDFVPGTNFMDFMDRGVSQAAAVVAVLSPSYLTSRFGRLEWMAAMRADQQDVVERLITIQVESTPLEGLLSVITYVDLVGVTDEEQARTLLLDRIEEAIAGRAKPVRQPRYPAGVAAGDPEPAGRTRPDRQTRPVGRHRMTTPATAPAFPPDTSIAAGRTELTILHVPGPRFGRGLTGSAPPLGADELQARIFGDLTSLTGAHGARPDLLVITGDLTETGHVKQIQAAVDFVGGMRAALGLAHDQVVIVPGSHDVNRKAAEAYFAQCESEDINPKAPYWPKYKHFQRIFEYLYDGAPHLVFDSEQPWTLFPVPSLRVVVAGLNSTVYETHREDDRRGWLGDLQAAWFAQRLLDYERQGWLRIGAVRHAPLLSGDDPTLPGHHPELLQDSATLDRLLGPRLNLLLHGSAAAGGGIHTGDSGVTVVGPPAPDEYQLLTVTADGLVRRAGRTGPSHRPDRTERAARRWHAAGGTFVTAAADDPPLPQEPAAEPDGGPDAGPDGEPDATRLLLDQVEEVVRVRHERPTVRFVGGRMPHLVVLHGEDGIVRRQRVAGHVGTVTGAELELFLDHVHAADPDAESELVYSGPPAPSGVRAEALRRGIRLRSLLEYQGLLDLREFSAQQAAQLRNDARYRPSLYVPQRFRELAGGHRAVRDDLVGELLHILAVDDGRFVLLMGEFGRGKTFALREVARRMPAQLPHLVPILIEMRSLEKTHSVEEMVAAHLARQGEDLIDLRAFRYMLEQGRIVLLFDGFDELATRVTYDRAADHLDVVLQAVQGKAKIVISSRTQHFRSDQQVLTALGERVGLLRQRRVLTVEEFDDGQIAGYLRNRYGGDKDAADTRLKLISNTQGLLGLSQNPRMLGFIADLDEARLRTAATSGGVVSAARLYEEILGAWLALEERRTGDVPGAQAGLTASELLAAVTRLAVRLFESNERLLGPAELADVAETLSAVTQARMSLPQTEHAVGAGSLLVRTEDGRFGFIHDSVAEWLVARAVADEFGARNPSPPLLDRRALSQLSIDFLGDLADPRAAQRWVRDVLATPGASDQARLNAMRIGFRLRTDVRTDLRGAVLRGEDLSYRDLADADLTGADLTDARLVGSSLARAVLRDARLVGTRLDEAILAGADLTGADLTRARLTRTDLSDTITSNTRWRRAALVEPVAAAELLEAAAAGGAAVTPGQPARPELFPAEIGVSYGFEVGRLPQPLAYDPSGETLAIGTDDGDVVVCDPVTGLPVRTLSHHRGRVYAVLFCGDDLLATGGADATIVLRDLRSEAAAVRLSGCADWVWPMEAAPDGASLAAGDSSGTVRIWDTRSGALRHELPGHATRVWTARFSPDGTLLATGDDDGVLRIWDTATGALRGEFPDVAGSVYRLVFDRTGTLLAAGCSTGEVRLYDPVGLRLVRALAGHDRPVYALDFSPRADLLVSGDTTGELRRWAAEDGWAGHRLGGQSGAVYSISFDAAGELLAAGDSDGLVRLWETEGWLMRRDLTGHRGSAWPMRFHPAGHQLVTSSNDGTVRLWDPATGQCRYVLRGHGRRINSVQFDATGTLLATSGNDGTVRLWEPRTGQQERSLTGHSDRLISAFFNPAAEQVGTASNDGGISLWQTRTGEYDREINVDTDHVWAATFSPDGDLLATANDDDTVQLWYRTTGRRVRILTEHRGRVRSVAFSPDGSLLATGCDDAVVRIWDVWTGEQRHRMAWHTDRVYSVAFAPDGTRLVTASHDGTACLFVLGTDEPATVFRGAVGRLWSAALHPDAGTLATAGDDGVVRLWDVPSGSCRHELVGHSRRIRSVDFSPDGTLLASAGDDGRVALWDVAGPPRLRTVLLGLVEGWAAVAPDGRYKQVGVTAGEFWHVVGTNRFEPGDLDPFVSSVRSIALAAEF